MRLNFKSRKKILTVCLLIPIEYRELDPGIKGTIRARILHTDPGTYLLLGPNCDFHSFLRHGVKRSSRRSPRDWRGVNKVLSENYLARFVSSIGLRTVTVAYHGAKH